MFQIISAKEAMQLIKDGDTIAVNAFLSLSNPETLHNALNDRFERTGHPKELTIFCPAGFGGWDENRFADQYVLKGAVKKVIASHYGSMPGISRLIKENKMEGYNLPLGVLSHSLRFAAQGQKGFLSKVGLNIFIDPRIEGAGMNECSKSNMIQLVSLGGEEFLYYPTPQIDIAFIKGTSVDPAGNISFDKEYLSGDALAMAQATKNHGGKVIVQVEEVKCSYDKPRNVVIPGALVDAVVVDETQKPLSGAYNPTLGGELHVPANQMDYWMSKLDLSGARKHKQMDAASIMIGNRAARELKKGQIVNIGVGMPETVGKCAANLGMLNEVTMTVESGGMGGLPAPGIAFGATMGADFICDMGQQFDFYDGGGLDICFMGALEIDQYGNVNAHCVDGRYVGIGGFANITKSTKNIVFCSTFSTKGLRTKLDGEKITIEQEGEIIKLKEKVSSISFSAKNAREMGQTVLYVTERCVFRLGKKGIEIAEVMPGIDLKTQILDLLPFSLES